LIPRLAVQAAEIPWLPTKEDAIGARDAAGRLYYAKTDGGSPAGRTPSALANELTYHVVAAASGLPMPAGALLEVDGRLAWGSEALPRRLGIPREEAAQVLAEACAASRQEFENLGRALLLDLALLNSDRRPWNILASREAGQVRLWYIDHGKSLVADGLEDCGLRRIGPGALSDARFGAYLTCAEANRLFLGRATDQDLRSLWAGLSLDRKTLELARVLCPAEWRPAALQQRLQDFLLPWWAHLAGWVSRSAPLQRLRELVGGAPRP